MILLRIKTKLLIDRQVTVKINHDDTWKQERTIKIEFKLALNPIISEEYRSNVTFIRDHAL